MKKVMVSTILTAGILLAGNVYAILLRKVKEN